LAVSRVTIYPGSIRSFFQSSPLAGTGRGAGRGLGHGEARAIAARMTLAARVNAGTFNQRTSSLVTSVVPIVRQLGGDAGTQVGVGTTVEHGKWLELGTEPHVMRPKVPFMGRGKGGYFLRSNTEKWIALKGVVPDGMELERPRLLVQHPGNRAYRWMSDAVRSVVPGLPVRVRVHK
jgi:hypothetical protein